MADSITIATWVKANSLSDFTRIFDFGTGTGTYMFLTPKVGSNMRFAITTGGNAAGQEQTINVPGLPVGVWKHVTVTLTGNTGIIYVDGVEVGRNNNMTLKPSSLGQTKNNYIGKSQYPDPYFNGLIDDFRIYSRALSAAEVATLASSTSLALNGEDEAVILPDLSEENTPQLDVSEVGSVDVTAVVGEIPALPTVVTVTYSDGTTKDVAVVWNEITAEQLATVSTFMVEGTVEGTELKAQANVTIIAATGEEPVAGES